MDIKRYTMKQSRLKIQGIIARRTKILRMKKGLTQKGLARRARIHWTYVTKIETGKKLPSLQTICKLGQSLDIKPYEFLVPEETRTPKSRKKQQLIETIRKARPREIAIFFRVISALRKG